ncbi:hypothetical protein ABK040_001989 [Willaertia magna]
MVKLRNPLKRKSKKLDDAPTSPVGTNNPNNASNNNLQQTVNERFINSKVFCKKLPERPEDLPLFVIQAMEYLTKFGLNIEGIFRISPKRTDEDEIIKKLEENINFEVPFEKYEIHLPSSLLKLYLRELPDPLLTYEQYGMFIAAETIPDDEQRLVMIKKVIKFLPPTNFEILKKLCLFLNKIAENQKVNKMSPQNLAIVFAPNLLKSNLPQTQMEMLNDSKLSNHLMTTLIESAREVFLSEEQLKQEEELKKQKEEELQQQEELQKVFGYQKKYNNNNSNNDMLQELSRKVNNRNSVAAEDNIHVNTSIKSINNNNNNTSSIINNTMNNTNSPTGMTTTTSPVISHNKPLPLVMPTLDDPYSSFGVIKPSTPKPLPKVPLTPVENNNNTTLSHNTNPNNSTFISTTNLNNNTTIVAVDNNITATATTTVNNGSTTSTTTTTIDNNNKLSPRMMENKVTVVSANSNRSFLAKRRNRKLEGNGASASYVVVRRGSGGKNNNENNQQTSSDNNNNNNNNSPNTTTTSEEEENNNNQELLEEEITTTVQTNHLNNLNGNQQQQRDRTNSYEEEENVIVVAETPSSPTTITTTNQLILQQTNNQLQEEEEEENDDEESDNNQQQVNNYQQEQQEEELEDGWEEGFDPNSGLVYYFNRALQTSRWDKPLKNK